MLPTSQPTYSEPRIAVSPWSATIEFDITTDAYRAWESIRIERLDDGSIRIGGRDDGPLTVPAPILPALLAEIDRLVTGDDEPPAPVVAIDVVRSDTFGGDAA